MLQLECESTKGERHPGTLARALTPTNSFPIVSSLAVHDLSGMQKDRRLIIAIDGPSASGKSTTARIVAERLGYVYIDTGAMYRALTFAAMDRGIRADDDANLAQLSKELNLEFRTEGNVRRVLIDGRDVSEEIRMPDVTAQVSEVSAHRLVREQMIDMQRRMARGGGVVLDGRDIGTVVFPGADLKIFLVADIEARAIRRQAELKCKGIELSETLVATDLSDRDRKDAERTESPLRPAEDSIRIDTSGLTIEEQVADVLRLARERLFDEPHTEKRGEQ